MTCTYAYFGLVLLAACLLALPSVATEYNPGDLFPYYAYDAGQPLNATEQLEETTFFHYRYSVTYQSVHGETVTGSLIKPKTFWAGPGPYPAILYLHGYGMSSTIDGFLADVIYLVEAIYGEPYVILAIDAQYHGQRAEPGRDVFSLNFIQDRAALATTVMDARRGLDYLQTRPDVMDNELHLIGISMGGILGALTMSVEPRLDAASLIVAGGNWTDLISISQLPPAIPMREALNGHYETIPRLMDMVDPVNLIPFASPEVALQMHNGTLDNIVPTGQQLFDAAGPPKEIHWYLADHVTIALYSMTIMSRALNWFENH
ncbi:MAG: alpha/beta fold hydrolase [Candidatus Zixiibacteriota bacterium]|nr:MAG: alpha/beta fold hydrolase [candidate division Zixibacteria bacterium]